MAFPDAQSVATLAAGVAGTLGTIKLIRFVASRRVDPDEDDKPRPHETVKQYKERLFPNGEKDEIILRIDQLAQGQRDLNRAVIKLESGQQETAKAIEGIDQRMAKHGI